MSGYSKDQDEFDNNLRRYKISMMCPNCGHATCVNCTPVIIGVKAPRITNTNKCCKCGKETQGYNEP